MCSHGRKCISPNGDLLVQPQYRVAMWPTHRWPPIESLCQHDEQYTWMCMRTVEEVHGEGGDEDVVGEIVLLTSSVKVRPNPAICTTSLPYAGTK